MSHPEIPVQQLPQDAAPLRVLVIHPQRVERVRLIRPLRTHFGRRASVVEAAGGFQALGHLAREPVDVALIGERLDDGHGLVLACRISQRHPQTATVLVAENDSPDLAAEVAKSAAHDYLVRGRVDPESLSRSIGGAMRQVRLQQDYRDVVRQMRETSEELDHFVRALSHDMNANFMVMEDSFSKLERSLRFGNSDEATLVELAAHVRACMSESKRFLNDLVDLARTGSVEMEPEPADAAAIVGEVLFEQRALIEERRVAVSVLGPLPEFSCNRRRLKQVVTNLVRNALKHGLDRQDPRLTIDASSSTSGSGPATLRIHDNGPGVPQSWCEAIFRPGCRLPGTQAEGSGMGLAIVRKIVAHYGGSVRVDSAAGEGTAFVIELPSAWQIEDAAEVSAAAGASPDSRLGHDTPPPHIKSGRGALDPAAPSEPHPHHDPRYTVDRQPPAAEAERPWHLR